jgi:hypothetical protein
MRDDSKTSRRFALLPLALLAFMAVLGLFLEAALYRTLLWETKIPLLALLAAAFLRWRSGSPGGPSTRLATGKQELGLRRATHLDEVSPEGG